MKNKIVIIVFIIIGVLLLGYLGYRVYNDFANTIEEENKQLDYLELYNYSLNEDDTDAYKTEFDNLRKVLNEEEVNYEEYASSISKLFIIDLYTIINKKGSTDIGGTEFIHNDLVDNFIENMGSSLYKNVQTNINGDRTQKLPEVSSVEVTEIKETVYKYNNEEYEGYTVNLTWTYVEDLGYQSSIKLTLIKSNNRLYIVKGE